MGTVLDALSRNDNQATSSGGPCESCATALGANGATALFGGQADLPSALPIARHHAPRRARHDEAIPARDRRRGTQIEQSRPELGAFGVHPNRQEMSR